METNYEKLIVWQKAMDLCVLIYKISETFPKQEQYGLSSQMRRSAVSIPSNIAEGAERNSKGEFRQFLGIAKGSAAELCTQSIISFKLGYLDGKNLDELKQKIYEILKILKKIISNLNSKF